MAKVQTKDTDRGYRHMVTALGKQAVISVGIHAAEGGTQEGGVAVSDYAAVHEFGAPEHGIPARSWLRGWFDEASEDNKKLFRQAMQGVVKGQVPSIEVAMDRVGLRFVGDIQKRITAGIEPALQQATIDRKGSSTPLIDTGTLRSSITHKVESK